MARTLRRRYGRGWRKRARDGLRNALARKARISPKLLAAYGHSYNYDAFRAALLEARAQGATHFDPSDLFGKATVYRDGGARGWQAALIKPSGDSGYHITAWQWAPFGVGPRSAGVMTIGDAIRRAA